MIDDRCDQLELYGHFETVLRNAFLQMSYSQQIGYEKLKRT